MPSFKISGFVVYLGILGSRYTFNRTILSVLCLPSFAYGSTLKGKNLLFKEQILSFKSRPFLKWFLHLGKQTGSNKNSHFEKMVAISGGVSFTLAIRKQ